MENIQLETMLNFAKQIVVSLRTSTLKISLVDKVGENLFQEILEYLEINQEVSKEELDILNQYKATFKLLPEDIFSMDVILLDIKEGKSPWQKPEVSFLNKLLENQFITEDESIRYLAHHNYYQKVMEVCEEKPELLQLAKKYGSERTRINFKNYEIMKALDSRLTPRGKIEKREKI